VELTRIETQVDKETTKGVHIERRFLKVAP